MYARTESIQSAGHPQVDPRIVAAGLATVLAIGVIVGYLAASLGAHGPSSVVSRAPAATVPAGGVNDRNVGRNPVPNSVISELDRANAARTAVTASNNGLCDRNSCGIVLPGSVSAVDRANAARVAALQAMPGVDWNAAAGDVYGVRDSRPPLAPFQLR
jgi:hypothetical protein